MSTAIDQKVVEMRFDNKQFERNVATSMSTLDKLKNALSLKGVAKEAESEFAAYRSGFISLKDSINKMWSTWEYEIASKMKNIVKSLTIDPIKTGFSEYETQINAVQTILANTESKGKTLEDVNSALDELNTYADKTIYNFTEMTRNIGTFTAAGVDLDTSVQAIKGIANLAAVSGSTSQQASTAMYQLSQAMASGTVKLMDWNSVVNAGMGGQVFQDALKETARVHGVAIDDIIAKNGSFRESLSEDWLTTEILTDTLAKFTGDLSEEQLKSQGYTEEQIKEIMKLGETANNAATKVKTFTQLFDTLKEAAQSGWTQTWEILVGDFEEAKEMLTEVSDVIGAMIGKSAESRNELLENWKVLGGRTDIIDSIKNVFHGLMDILAPIKEAFRDIFPPLTAERLKSFSEGLKNLTAKFKISEGTADKIRRTFKGVFAVFDIVKQALFAVFAAVASLTRGLGGLGGGVLDITASFGDWLAKLSDTIRMSDIFNKVLQGVVDILKAALGGMTSFIGFIKEKIVSPGLEAFSSLLESIREKMSVVGGAAGAMKDGIISAFDSTGKFLENSSFFKVIETIWKAITKIGSGIFKVFSGFTRALADSTNGTDIFKIIQAIVGLLTGGLILKIIELIKGIKEPLDETIGGLSEMFSGVKGVLDDFRGCLEAYQSKLKAETLKTIAIAIAILVASILVLSLIDSEKVYDAVAVLAMVFAELLVAMNILNKMQKSKGMSKTTAALLGISTALLVLSAALKIMSTMSWNEMVIGLTTMAVALAALVLAVNLLPEAKVKSAATAIKKISTALLILSVAIKIMSTMSWGEMTVGLTTMVVGLAALVAAVHLLPKNTGVKVAGMISLALAMLVLSASLKIMATMSWGEVAISLVTLAGALGILAVGMQIMKSAIPGALAMLIVAPALLVLTGVLKILGTMNIEQVGLSLLALGGAFGILAIGLLAMKSAISGAFALLVASAALAVLAPVLLILGSMSWESIIKGMVALAAAFTVIGLAASILSPSIPSIMGLAVAMALIGVAVLAAGAGLMAFSAGLTALAVGATAVVGALGAIVTGIIAIIEAILVGVANGIVAFCKVIADGVPIIGDAIKSVILTICDVLIKCVPKIVEVIGVVLTEILKFLVDFTPKIVDAGMKIVIGFIDGIAKNIGKVVESAVNLIIKFTEAIASQIPRVNQAAVDLILKFINSLASSIRDNTPKVISAVNNLMSAIFEAIGMAIGNIPSLGMNIAKGLAKGIRQGLSSAVNAAKELGQKVLDKIKKFFKINSPSKKFVEIGMDLNEGMALGLEKYSDLTTNAAVGVGEDTMNSLGGVLSNVADSVNGNMDIQPTIRPVLDLSDVKSRAGAISGLLNTGSSVDVMANVGSINSMMARRNQNEGNSDLVSAINKLRNQMGNTGNTTYNVNGVTYDDGSNVANAIKSIVRAARIERRV